MDIQGLGEAVVVAQLLDAAAAHDVADLYRLQFEDRWKMNVLGRNPLPICFRLLPPRGKTAFIDFFLLWGYAMWERE